VLLQWLKAARAEEAAVIAASPVKVNLMVQPGGHIHLKLQVWEPLPQPADPAAAAAAGSAADAEKGTAGVGSGTAASASPVPMDVDSQQQQQQQQDPAAAVASEADAAAAAAAAVAAAQEQLARQPLAFKPRLLEELVRFKRSKPVNSSSNSSQGTDPAVAAAAADEAAMQVDATSAVGQAAQQQQQQQGVDATVAAHLQEAPDDWHPPGRISYLIVPLKNAANSSSSSSAASTSGVSGLADPQHIPAEAYPSLNIRAAGLDPSWTPAIDWAKVQHMGEGVVSLPDLMAKALGLQQQQQTQGPERMVLPPLEPPAAIPEAAFAAAAAARRPPALAGAATMTPLPADLKPEAVSKLEAALRGRILVAGHISQVYSALGVAAGLTPASSLSLAVAGLVDRYGMAGTAAAGMQNDLATFAPLLAQDNPEMAAAVMLSASLADKDPEQRPMLGWKVGKTDDGKPIWESTDRHDDYYRLRFGVTGFRPDVPMLAVKSSRGLTDCCLLPPRIEVSAILGPQPEQQQQQQAEQQPEAAAAAAAGASGSAAGGAAVGSKRPPQQRPDSSAPDKRRLVQPQQQQQQGTGSTAAPSAAAAGTTTTRAGLVVEKTVDRLAHWEQQQQQQQDEFKGLTQAQLDEAGKRLAAMSSSARRKAWAQHRVMFLPLELGWVLPLTSPEWSQLQLVPNIMYRIDSMLQASCVHKQLWELLRGGGPKAATKVCTQQGCCGFRCFAMLMTCSGCTVSASCAYDPAPVCNREKGW
jgi:hypothetical protein